MWVPRASDLGLTWASVTIGAMARARELLAVPVRGRTWLRCVYLAIGIALVAPYGTLAELLREALEPALGAAAALGLAIVACFVALPLATGMLAAVRELEIVAVRRLLGVQLDDVEAPDAVLSWSTRWRAATWYLLHVVIGGLIATLTLALPGRRSPACAPRSRRVTCGWVCSMRR